MIGRSGFHGLLRNLRVSPWTRRSLTERLLLSRTESTAKGQEKGQDQKQNQPAPPSPSTSLSFRAWQASLAVRLNKDKKREGT
jgi:hypothetical protein